jgi:hypothetical protein
MLDGHDGSREVGGELVDAGECPGRGVDVDHVHGHAPPPIRAVARRLRQLRMLAPRPGEPACRGLAWPLPECAADQVTTEMTSGADDDPA